LCVTAAVCLSPGVAGAEKGRTLGGYRFVTGSVVEEPFITTQFRNFIGMSIANDVKFPLVVVPDTPPDTLLGLNGDFVFVVANFEYQHVVHPRVALRVAAGGASRVGTSGQALLSQGVTAIYNAQLGAIVELWRNDTVLLSASADAGYTNGLVIDFVQFVTDIIDENYMNASLVSVVDGAGGNAALRAAWALNSWAGLLGIGQVGISNVGNADDKALWRFAASGSVDFGQRGNAPVGLLLSLDVDRLKPQAADIKTSVGIGAGVYYTGREDLNLGLEAEVSHWPLEQWDTAAYVIGFGFALRYYF
jgi:hypothetical protein